MPALTQPDRLQVGSDEVAFRVRSDQSEGALVAFDIWIPAGGGPPMLHRHDAFELYRVELGELVFYLEDEDGCLQRAVAQTGSVVAIPGGREHTVRNESDVQAKAFVVLSPGAGMERFIRAAGELAAEGPPRVEQVLAVAEAHGITMTRPLEGVA